MKKWMAVMLLIALALFGSVIGFNMFKQKKIAEFMANRPEPEFPVTAMVTKAQDWVPTIEAIGFIEPNLSFGLHTDAGGKVTLRIWFELEARPPWAASDAAGERDVWIDLDVHRSDAQRAAAELRTELQDFPPRALTK